MLQRASLDQRSQKEILIFRVYRFEEIDPKLAFMLRRWIEKDRAAKDPANPYLFPSRIYPVSQINEQGWKLHFKKYMKRAGLPGYYSIHSLRHSCAVQLIANGAGPVAVMQWLRLRRISNAQVYFERMAIPMNDTVKKAFGNLM